MFLKLPIIKYCAMVIEASIWPPSEALDMYSKARVCEQEKLVLVKFTRKTNDIVQVKIYK